MASKCSGGRELTQLMADHVLNDVDRHMFAAVVYGDRMAYHVREDGGGTRPGLDDLLVAGLVHLIDALQQLRRCEGAFLYASAHLRSLLTLRCGA